MVSASASVCSRHQVVKGLVTQECMTQSGDFRVAFPLPGERLVFLLKHCEYETRSRLADSILWNPVVSWWNILSFVPHDSHKVRMGDGRNKPHLGTFLS